MRNFLFPKLKKIYLMDWHFLNHMAEQTQNLSSAVVTLFVRNEGEQVRY